MGPRFVDLLHNVPPGDENGIQSLHHYRAFDPHEGNQARPEYGEGIARCHGHDLAIAHVAIRILLPELLERARNAPERRKRLLSFLGSSYFHPIAKLVERCNAFTRHRQNKVE
jgi:hypothetical protein